MSRKKKKVDASAGEAALPNASLAFGALDALADLPAGPEGPLPATPEKTSKRGQKNTSRGRVDLVRQTAHRGGKVVTIAQNFVGIGAPEIQSLAKKMQKSCGAGGTVKEGRIEIQGDKREEMKRILTEAGFNPVFSGG